MKDVTVILGKHKSGKTLFAKRLSQIFRTCYLSEISLRRTGLLMKHIPFDTELIVIDDLSEINQSIDELIRSRRITVDTPLKVRIKRPPLILISEGLSKDDFKAYEYYFIEFLQF